ncbi:MFS transporter [Rhodococcus sp. T2V]|uniref:MFS transporter n=1 Tax=Rhodococcus sp. T2V TaxID=3034164 RepID=UPI0023E34282|nr:MFS transporter [Rhodococcus sp. T2V]
MIGRAEDPVGASSPPELVASGAPSGGLGIAFVLAIGLAVVAIIPTAVVPLLGTLAGQLHGSASSIAWSVTAVSLAYGVTNPACGRLGDIYGYRNIILACLAITGIGTVLCAIATAMPMFLVGRILQGAAGGLIPVSIGLVRNTVSPDKVRVGMGLVNSGIGLGVGVGFMLGGLLQDYAWNVTFWIMLVFVLVAIVSIAMLVPRPQGRSSRSLRDFDLIGAVLITIGATGILLPLSKGAEWGWTSPTTLGLFAAGAAVLVVFAKWESRHVAPLVQLRLFAVPHFLLPNIAVALLAATTGAVFIFFVGYTSAPPDLAGYGFGASVLRAGSFMLPYSIMAFLVSPLSARLGQGVGARTLLITGGMLTTLTFAFLTWNHDQQWQIYLGSAVYGIALACFNPALYALVADAFSIDKAGVAQGMSTLSEQLGSSVGSAATTAVLAASLIPGTQLSTAGAYTHAYVLCVGFATVGLIVAVVEAFIHRTRGSAIRGR